MNEKILYLGNLLSGFVMFFVLLYFRSNLTVNEMLLGLFGVYINLKGGSEGLKNA